MNDNYTTFIPLNVSSKFAICGLPIRLDTYMTCSFGCRYCFSNYREIMGFEKKLKVANIGWLDRKLKKVLVDKKIIRSNFLEVLISEGITWHCGGMSDPFQPIEKKLGITSKLLAITNKHNISILFSTKTDDVYDWTNLKPELHSFQLSVTNLDNRTDIEPNVAPIESRIKFYKELKRRGFKVGIRIQPFIPDVSTSQIVDVFNDADYFSIEGLKLVPNNKEQIKYLTKILKLSSRNFVNIGLMNLKPNIRLKLYKTVIEKLDLYGVPYSIADNDLHYISKSKCCCGEPLIKKSTDFNNTALFFNNPDYDLDDVRAACGLFGKCKAKELFCSNRQEGCITVNDFFEARFNRASSPFSKKFMYCFHDSKQKRLTECIGGTKP